MGAQKILTQAGFVIRDVKKLGDAHMGVLGLAAYLLGMGVGDIYTFADELHLSHALPGL